MLTLCKTHSRMKFPCILFAMGVYMASFPMIDMIAAQVNGYEDFEEFLTDVKTTADSLLDYVTKMQVLFCPNQPVCGANGELERPDVLGTLPAVITVGNVTVNVGDIADYVDVCCMHCSCSNACWQVKNCCATKQMYPDTRKNLIEVEHECIAAHIVSYRNKLALDASKANHMYPMVTSCSVGNTTLTLVAECQHPDPDALSNNIPVTSRNTGNTYWNKPCAICNGDDDDIIEWIPHAIIKTNIPYFSNTSSPWSIPYPDTNEKLTDLLSSRRKIDIMYIPPESILPVNHKCIREDFVRSDCKQHSEEDVSSTLDWLVESCTRVFSPVQYGLRGLFHKSIFRLVSHTSLELIANKQVCKSLEEIKSPPGYLTALLNYKLEADKPAPLQVDGEKCDCTEMFDPYLNLCRPLYCSSGEIQIGCHCVQPFRQLSGMPVALMVKVTTHQDGLNRLTSGQLRKIHTALEKALEATAVKTTAKIATTLQQENATSLTYLCIAIAYSDLGTDTKLAMRPFLKYLDTDEVLRLRVEKLHLTAVLTTNARLWIEQEHNQGFFKVCCLDQQLNQLLQVYVNVDVVNSGQIGQGIYQPMSRLLYCKQVELNQTEHYITDSGIININVTEPMISASDYRPVSASRVRVCADMYVPKASRKGNGSMGALCGCSVKVMVISIVSVVVTGMMN